MLMLVICAAGGVHTAFATPFTNGSLTPADPSAVAVTGYLLSNSGLDTTTLPGWTINSVDLVSTYWQAPTGGTYSVDLNGWSSGLMYQTFDTITGHLYTVSFYYAGNPDTPVNNSPLRQATTYVLDGGINSGVYVNASGAAVGIPMLPANLDVSVTGTTRTDMLWTLETYTFQAIGASSTLVFRGNLSHAQGIVVGNVSGIDEGMTLGAGQGGSTPEPMSAALMGVGLTAVALLRRRRQ